jgi:putative transport protein
VDGAVDFLAENPLLLLFLVAALGQLLGSIRVGSFSLGVAGVLFVGIAVGAVDEKLELPTLVYELGLALFVYALGLSAGPAFVASLKGPGRRRVAGVTLILIAGAAAAVVAARALSLTAGQGAGLFAGVLTNTPALAGVVESLSSDPSRGDPAEPTVAYSLTYPGSVIATIIVIVVARRIAPRWPDLPQPPTAEGDQEERIVSRVVRVTRELDVRTLDAAASHQVLVGRIERDGVLFVADPTAVLRPGDLVSLIGQARRVEALAPTFGEITSNRMLRDRSVLDFRRIFVSDASLSGRRIGDLDLPSRFGALVTRVRRGDVDIVGHPDVVLELGDRVRVIAPPARMPELTKLFGDSYRALGEVDVAGFSIGLALGLLLGAIEVPLPGGASFSLGFAGGPLVAGLVLGTLRRTGPLQWQPPHTAGMTLRQFGLVLFLAGIGTSAGQQFADTVTSAEGVQIVLVGFALSLALATCSMLVALRVDLSFWAAAGYLGGVFTQPATLAFASGQARSAEPEESYAQVAPFAILLKILLAQVVLLVLLR